MSITIGKKQFKLSDIAAGGILLSLYLLQVSILGVGMALPFAFLWLMWILNGIKANGEKRISELEKKIEQMEAR